MNIPKIPLAQTLIQLFKAKEIRHIVISPGSRNAPLTIGFTNDPFFECYSIIDERCAAFFALGISQQIKHPVAVVCTSGSALLNYFPAVAEAFYSDIPLVVVSADRPNYLVGIGDGQTIDQKEVFGTHVLHSSNLKLDINLEKEGLIKKEEELPIFKAIENSLEDVLGMQSKIQQENEKEINSALNTAITNYGPVHINCPFDEPLYETVDNYSIEAIETKRVLETIIPNDNYFDSIASIWNKAQKKMILVGVNTPDSIHDDILHILAKDNSVVVFTETTSNLYHENFFPSIDKIIAPLDANQFENLKPDILLTMGGMVVSKKIKSFLRHYQPKHHWHVDIKKANDTYFCLDKHITCSPQEFFSRLISRMDTVKSSYHADWDVIKTHRGLKHNDYLKTIPFSDFTVFNTVLTSIPSDANLHLSNSSTIRYTQLFELDRSLKVFCNRGTSGIDGSTSTAIGSACVSNNQSVFITGDLSFFYDSNALWNNYMPNDFRIIIINNGGGGIFRILPGHKNTENFDQYFETTHGLNASDLCKMYHLEYASARNITELNNILLTFYDISVGPKLLEIFTPRTDNDEILLNYFTYIK